MEFTKSMPLELWGMLFAAVVLFIIGIAMLFRRKKVVKREPFVTTTPNGKHSGGKY